MLKRRRILIYLGLPILVLLIVLIVIFALRRSDSMFAGGRPERISIAYAKDIVPFHFTDEEGQPAGITIDIWRLWSEKTGIEIDFQEATWDRTLVMVGDGKADVPPPDGSVQGDVL